MKVKFLLSISVILIMIYSIGFYLFLNYKISEPYRIYYVEKKTQDWLGNNYQRAMCQIGDTINFDASYRLNHRGVGWKKMKYDWTFRGQNIESLDTSAYLYVKINTDNFTNSKKLYLCGVGNVKGAFSIDINNTLVGHIDNSNFHFPFVCKKSDSLLTIKFFTNNINDKIYIKKLWIE